MRPHVALLERHGVVTREAVLAEGLRGGFAAVYPILKAMEEAGRARRGYFVAGLGAAQFALPGRRRPAACRRARCTPGSRGPSSSRPPIRRSRMARRSPGRGGGRTSASPSQRVGRA